MLLKDFIKLCPDVAITVHRNGRLDNHYLAASDIDSEFLSLSVVQVGTSYVPDLTDLYVWVEDPADLMEEDNDSLPF